MATVSLSSQQHQQMIDRIAGLESMMTNLQSHAESQQEQIRVAELVIQQWRTAGTPTNPPPPTRGTSLKQVTEGGAFKALRKCTGNHSEYHDRSFSARRILIRADERFAGLLQWISGTIDEMKESDVLEYRRTTDLSTADLDWQNSELCAMLDLKTTDAALASIKALEEAATTGERSARISQSTCVASHRTVTHPERAQKAADLQHAYYRCENNLKEYQRGSPTGLDEDVKANAMRHMMPKEILDAVDLQPQHRTFVEIRDYMLQQARQRADVFV